MKRNTPRKLLYERIIRGQLARARRKIKTGKTPLNRIRLCIPAPKIIDLYNPRNHKLLISFLQRIRAAANNKRGVFISFDKTHRITAAGGILLLAEIDRLVKFYGTSRIKASYPVSDINSGDQADIAKSVLQKIGLYTLMGYPDSPIKDFPSVSCWESVSGDTADGSLVGTLLNKIDDILLPTLKRKLYRGAFEALANSCEHAYMSSRNDEKLIDDRRWWAFTAKKDDRLTVLVCDLGTGIPNTIQHTQPPDLLSKILSIIKVSATTDGAWIQAATMVKKTRTQQSHRGKGGGDLRSIVESEEGAVLSIFSNRGRFRLSNNAEIYHDHKSSILGTIVEWSVKVE